MGRLFDSFLSGEGLATAVQRGRAALAAEPVRISVGGSRPLSDWVVPVLFQAEGEDNPLLFDSLPIVEPKPLASSGTVSPTRVFVGRSSVMLELERAFRRSSVVILVGMAGAGKTQTAKEYIRWLANTGGLLGPVVLLDGNTVSTFDPSKATTPAFLLIDDIDRAPGTSSDESVDTQHLFDSIFALGSETIKVLVITRGGPLAYVAGRTVRLRGLSQPEASDLAEKTYQTRQPGRRAFELNELLSLLTHLMGNPRAIIEAADLLADHTPDDVRAALLGKENAAGAAILSSRISELVSLEKLRSKSLTGPTMKTVLNVLAPFRGVVCADTLFLMSREPVAPPSLAGLTPMAWNDLLQWLGRAGLLLEIVAGTHELHPNVPLIANAVPGTGEIGAEGMNELYLRGFAAFGEFLVSLAHSHPGRAADILSANQENLLAAVERGIAAERWEILTGPFMALAALYRPQSRWREWSAIVLRVEAAAEQCQDVGASDLRVAVHAMRSELARHGLYEHTAKTSSPSVPDDEINPLITVSVEMADGVVALEQRRLSEARASFDRAMMAVRRVNEPGIAAQIAVNLGIVSFLEGSLLAAGQWYEESLRLADGNPLAMVSPLYQTAHHELQLGNFRKSERLFEECRRTAAQTGNRQTEALACTQLGVAVYQQGRREDAERWQREGLRIAHAVTDLRARTHAHIQLAPLAVEKGDLGEGLRWALLALDDAKNLKDLQLTAGAESLVGDIYLELGESEEAAPHLQNAVDLFSRLGDVVMKEAAKESLLKARAK